MTLTAAYAFRGCCPACRALELLGESRGHATDRAIQASVRPLLCRCVVHILHAATAAEAFDFLSLQLSHPHGDGPLANCNLFSRLASTGGLLHQTAARAAIAHGRGQQHGVVRPRKAIWTARYFTAGGRAQDDPFALRYGQQVKLS